jgi:hypothetical protein
MGHGFNSKLLNYHKHIHIPGESINSHLNIISIAISYHIDDG